MIITISGLPRSGTAFLGNFLAQREDAIAFHELAAYDKNWRETLISEQDKFKYVINSCTYGHHKGGYIKSDYCIWINNHPEESFRAAQEMNGDISFYEKSYKAGRVWVHEAQKEGSEFLWTTKKGVFSAHGLGYLWRFVYGETPDIMKVTTALRLKVEHDKDQIMDYENRSHDEEIGYI